MKHRRALPGLALVFVLALVTAVACRDDAGHDSLHTKTSTRPVTPHTPGSTSPTIESTPDRSPTTRDQRLARTDDPYRRVAALLAARGVRIWWESDLVARWLDGRASFAAAVRRLGTLARQRGTAGIKVADEIGYHDGLTSPRMAREFLSDVNSALVKVAPQAAILVDAVVLELGCLPRTYEAAGCARDARRTAPAATIDAVTSYLRAGLIDRLDLSTGLGEAKVYPRKDLAAAQDVAWTYVGSGPWPSLTRLQSRKALARPGGYTGSPTSDLRVHVHTPRRHGAAATDIWTWRQTYQNQTVSLFGSGDPRQSPLWRPLLAERRRGTRLFTHMTPSALATAPGPLARECALAAQVFTDVFVAAGTG